jgi:hypothetical protein
MLYRIIIAVLGATLLLLIANTCAKDPSVRAAIIVWMNS